MALSMDVYNGDYIDTEGRKQLWPEEFLRKNIETTELQRQAFTRAHEPWCARNLRFLHRRRLEIEPTSLQALLHGTF